MDLRATEFESKYIDKLEDEDLDKVEGRLLEKFRTKRVVIYEVRKALKYSPILLYDTNYGVYGATDFECFPLRGVYGGLEKEIFEVQKTYFNEKFPDYKDAFNARLDKMIKDERIK